MSDQFAIPNGKKLLNEVRDLFRGKNVFKNRDRHIVFVCGGPVSVAAKPRTMRSWFVEWVKRELPEIITLLAEKAFRDTYFHDPPETVNLSTFETQIAEIADCVVIFLESVGSFAEIGFFSSKKNIYIKTLVVNELQYQAKDSFVNLGPIKTINSKSFLDPAIYLENRSTPPDFSPLRERLSRVLDRSHRKRFNYSNYGGLKYGEKFLAVLETINILRVVTLGGLRESIKVSFDSANSKDLKQILSILIAAECVTRRGDFFAANSRAISFLEFESGRVNDLKTRIVYSYQKYHTQSYEHLRES